ncbi:hypothetical protein G7Y79_00011g029480 [Physcia stellaris]|nr:hypothetical protein G7Y79_00011g029480 [Physcia stellaris]
MPLKFLCLPGAYTNADTLRVQLVKALESEGLLSFRFTQGAYEADPPPGFETWFGNPPHLRFLEELKFSEFDVDLQRLRFFEPLDNSEDSMRELFRGGEVPSTETIHNMLDPLYRVLEEEGPFHGVLGYSEGAGVAATLLVSNQRRCEAQGIENTLTNAIFFSGAPPLDPDVLRIHFFMAA